MKSAFTRKRAQQCLYNIILSSIPSPLDLPDPGIEPGSPALQADFFYQLNYEGSIVITKDDNYLHDDGLVVKSCPTLCDPMDCRLPGSSVHGISQARILEWVAISFSRGSS